MGIGNCILVPVKAMGSLSVAIADMAPFLNHIVDIGLPRTGKQVGGVDAGLVVTVVTNLHAYRDWTIRKLPRETMRSGRSHGLRYKKLAIGIAVPCPQPTGRSKFRVNGAVFVNLGPEAFFWCSVTGAH